MLAGVIREPCASEHLQTEADVHRQRKENQGQAEPWQQAAETVDAIDDGLVSSRPQPQRVHDQVLNHHDAEDDACHRVNFARAEPLSASAGTRFIDLCSRGRRADLNYMQCFHHDVVSGCQYESALTTSTPLGVPSACHTTRYLHATGKVKGVGSAARTIPTTLQSVSDSWSQAPGS